MEGCIVSRRRKNKGMAVVELTLLIPIVLGVVYLYIMLFLYLTECANTRQILAKTLYMDSLADEGGSGNVQAKVLTSKHIERAYSEKDWEGFCVRDEMCKGEDSILEDIRRWQIARNALRNGAGD